MGVRRKKRMCQNKPQAPAQVMISANSAMPVRWPATMAASPITATSV